MWESTELKNHLQTSTTIESQSAVIVEWNMNVPGNIFKLGNYRYRKNSATYSALPNFFDRNDSSNFYTNATYADTVIENGVETDGVTPILFTSVNELEKLYYSLEDCIKPFRPRSGINKAVFFKDKFFTHPNKDMFLRPRYYMPHRDDYFKYWRSYRTESPALENGFLSICTLNNELSIPNYNKEYGISDNSSFEGNYSISDAVPFVVYKESVPANRIILKVQTHVGDIDLGTFKKEKDGTTFSDPFYGNNNKTTPKIFKVQYLDENDLWIDAYSFNSTSRREDNTEIFGSDGYLSLQYGLQIPFEFNDSFVFVGFVQSTNALPEKNIRGHSYILQTTENTKGLLYVWDGIEYKTFTVQYNWKIGTDGVYENTQFVTDFTNPSYFLQNGNIEKIYREFVFIKGIRIVVETMNVPDVPFELIEFSPRLVADISGKVLEFGISKMLSDLGNAGMPVGQLMASSGQIGLFDDDQSFNINNQWDGNTGSIIAKYMQKNIKFNFYEVIKNVNNINYYVPIKTLYSDSVPQVDQNVGNITITLRDFYFYFESLKAPQILLTNVSLSQAVAMLLDSVGFSNYIFKRLSTENDPIIPYFFISPDQNIVDVLQNLAVSTQSAMFFDEYNNFVVMTKNYLLDDTGERKADVTMYGSQSVVDSGVIENTTSTPLPNIMSISSADQKVFNDGNITYTERYIQRSYGSIRQSQMVDQDKTWIYKPVLLWEVSGTEATKTANNTMQSNYVLSAMPLNSNLTSVEPKVVNRVIVNNVIDFGENVYWLSRYNGYFYSSGEIIRYDAVEYTVTLPIWYPINSDGSLDYTKPQIVLPGRLAPNEITPENITSWRNSHRRGISNVWISSNLEYQNYFSKIPFNGKMYPTGNVRIYSEPYYENVDGITKLKNGAVVQHGRAQFGTEIQLHSAGLSDYWSNNAYVQGCDMASQYLYTTEISPTLPAVTAGSAGVNKIQAEKSVRNGIIKNYFASGYESENGIIALKTTQTGTIQSSALVFNGPIFTSAEKPRDFISYVWKTLEKPYKHFGTRVRVIGKIESSGETKQTPIGSTSYYNITNSDPTKSVSLGGGSAGVCIANPITNEGYYFEIAALTDSNINSYLKTDTSGNSTINLDNIIFYKIQNNTSDTKAVPTKLWGGIGNIIVDDGNFVGQYRVVNEENPTVYDLAIEYIDVNDTTRTFYLYINGKLVQTVTEKNPLPIQGNTMGIFVRGSTKAMFENLYALGENFATDTTFKTGFPIASVFGDSDKQINANEAMTKYALSGVIQKTFLQGIRPAVIPRYNLYYEEFGSIMREAAYFNIRYDKAYPALYAKISDTFNRIKGYTVSGFSADAYGAEFLIFNATDKALSLDETTGNYLRIQGVTFTQDTTHKLTVDDYYKKRGNLSNPELKGDTLISSPYKYIEEYDKIRVSRIKYGKNEFVLQADYIQDQDSAAELVGWISNKMSRPRKAVGMEIFSMPTLQLGDIININYKTEDGIDIVVKNDVNLVVYQIEYGKSIGGPTMTVYASEV